MKREDRPMWDDPAESAHVRELLRAGRSARMDYDAEHGLARHLMMLQSGAPLPKWAISGAIAKGGVASLLSWLLPPLVSVAALGAWHYLQPTAAEPRPALSALASERTPSEPVVAEAAIASAAAPLPVQPSELSKPRFSTAASERSHASRSVNRIAPHASGHVLARSAPPHAAVSLHRAPASTDGEGTPYAEDALQLTASNDAAPSLASQSAPTETAAPARIAQAPASAAVTAPQPKAVASETQPAAQERHAVATVAQPVQSDARLEREMQMLAVAQRVLKDDPRRALRLAREGEREFGGSMFSPDRKQVGLLALVQLGRLDEARRLAAPFLRTYPNAPWSARLRQALATGRVPTE